MDFKIRTAVVTFRDSDGQTIGTMNLRQAGLLEGQALEEMVREARIINTEELRQAQESKRPFTAADVRVQLFRETFYPYMAASASGDVPTVEEALLMPNDQFNDWYVKAREVNPKWFEAWDAAGDAIAKALANPDAPESKEIVKKKGRKRVK